MDPRRLERLKAYLVARLSHTLADYEVSMPQDEFNEAAAALLREMYPTFKLDNLLVRPKEAIRFCDAVRDQVVKNWDLPDDMVLQSLLNFRKSGATI